MRLALPSATVIGMLLTGCGADEPAESSPSAPSSTAVSTSPSTDDHCETLFASGGAIPDADDWSYDVLDESYPDEELLSRANAITTELVPVVDEASSDLSTPASKVFDALSDFVESGGDRSSVDAVFLGFDIVDVYSACEEEYPEARAPITPKSSPTPEAAQFEYSCWLEESGRKTYSSFEQAWALPYSHCDVERVGGEISDNERKALEVAYGAEAEELSLRSLYNLCARTVGVPVDKIVSGGQAEEAAGAILLCPEHPKAAQIQANIEKGMAVGKEEAAIEADRANGKFVGSGSYLIGSDVQPGTWQSQGPKVEDCYWEVSDASGNIIANNFISVAPQFTIVVPADAAGFTVENCSFRWIGG